MFCLRYGLGFGNNTVTPPEEGISYILRGDFKTQEGKQSIISYYTDNSFGNLDESIKYTETTEGEEKEYLFTRYNALVWLANHIYLSNKTNTQEMRDNFLTPIFGETTFNFEDGSNKTYMELPENKKITEDDIDVIEQCAFWYFANYDTEFARINGGTAEKKLTNMLTIHDMPQLDEIRVKQIDLLYEYLVKTAKKEAGDSTEIPLEPELPVINLSDGIDPNNQTPLSSSVFEISKTIGGQEYSYCVAGPFNLKTENPDDIWKIAVKPSFTYELANGESVTLNNDDINHLKIFFATIIDLNSINELSTEMPKNQNFFIFINKEEMTNITTTEQITKCKLNIKIDFTRDDKDFTLWTATPNDQPVILVEPKTINKIIDDQFITIENSKVDLSLRKFISMIERKDEEGNYKPLDLVSREPQVSTSNLNKLVNGVYMTTAEYSHSKEAIVVKPGDIITYTIRVYNEGNFDGYANEIRDHILQDEVDSKLKFLNGSEINTKFRWAIVGEINQMLPLPGDTNEQVGNVFSTDYLSLAHDSIPDEERKIAPYVEGEPLKYKDVQIQFEVVAPFTYDGVVRNIAEITEMVAINSNGNEVDLKDRDSNENGEKGNLDLTNYDFKNAPANSTYQEDDDDYETIKLTYFDLSLRKFITKINDETVDNRIPVVTYNDETGKLVYTHGKEPVNVANADKVTYTIRVYNEGRVQGYAEIVSDDIPQGLKYIPDDETNNKYKWKMYKWNDTKTELIELVEGEDISKAEIIKTDYLSKANGELMIQNTTERSTLQNPNLIKPFDPTKPVNKEEPLNPDYRDVEIVFQVDEKSLPETSREIKNLAQISKDSDDDADSTPDEWIEGEDDQDFEVVKVKEFDLGLLKWVTKTIVSVDGKTTTTETGFLPNQGLTEQVPDGKNIRMDKNEPIAQVVVDKKKINKTNIKFVYSIKVINEGELPGYATEITDYIPNGLKFVPEDNPIWVQSGDNKITTKTLENTLLAPGESKVLEVILTWINDEDNFGLKTNIAAITKDFNDFGDTDDIDSRPEEIDKTTYQTEQQDDDDLAVIILTVMTGSGATYFALSLAVLAIIATGVLFIKRYVL